VEAPTAAGEALLPDLIALFTDLAASQRAGRPRALTPPLELVELWKVRHSGRFRHYGRPSPGVWTATTFRCRGCEGAAGPWTVTCDWRLLALGCPCGVVTDDHGLTLSEVWLCLPDV
jgi:hypothetical protein